MHVYMGVCMHVCVCVHTYVYARPVCCMCILYTCTRSPQEHLHYRHCTLFRSRYWWPQTSQGVPPLSHGSSSSPCPAAQWTRPLTLHPLTPPLFLSQQHTSVHYRHTSCYLWPLTLTTLLLHITSHHLTLPSPLTLPTHHGPHLTHTRHTLTPPSLTPYTPPYLSTIHLTPWAPTPHLTHTMYPHTSHHAHISPLSGTTLAHIIMAHSGMTPSQLTLPHTSHTLCTPTPHTMLISHLSLTNTWNHLLH